MAGSGHGKWREARHQGPNRIIQDSPDTLWLKIKTLYLDQII